MTPEQAEGLAEKVWNSVRHEDRLAPPPWKILSDEVRNAISAAILAGYRQGIEDAAGVADARVVSDREYDDLTNHGVGYDVACRDLRQAILSLIPEDRGNG